MAASGNAGRTQEAEVHHPRSKGLRRRRASLAARLGARGLSPRAGTRAQRMAAQHSSRAEPALLRDLPHPARVAETFTDFSTTGV